MIGGAGEPQLIDDAMEEEDEEGPAAAAVDCADEYPWSISTTVEVPLTESLTSPAKKASPRSESYQ